MGFRSKDLKDLQKEPYSVSIHLFQSISGCLIYCCKGPRLKKSIPRHELLRRAVSFILRVMAMAMLMLSTTPHLRWLCCFWLILVSLSSGFFLKLIESRISPKISRLVEDNWPCHFEKIRLFIYIYTWLSDSSNII